MRRLFLCLFILSLVLGVSSAFAATMEMIPNPGFENGADATAPPWYNQPAWGGGCTGQAVAGTPENPAHSGTRMWQMSGAIAGETDTVEIIPTFAPGGGYFKCHAYVRVPSASPSNPVQAQLRIWFGNPANMYIDGYWGSPVTITSSDWTLLDDATTTGLFASSPCTQVIFRVRVTSTDPSMVAYVDDASAVSDRHNITGKVVDNTGAPVAGANVFISASNPPDVSGTPAAVTAADGTYSTAGTDGAELYAMAVVPGGKYSESSVVTIPASTTDTTAADLVVAKIATVKLVGKVVDAATGLPIEGASVAVNDAGGIGFNSKSILATTDATGTYQAEVLDADANPIGTYEYYVIAKKLGYINSSELYVDITNIHGTMNLSNLQLAVDPNYDPSLLLNANVQNLGLGDWPTTVPADGKLTVMGTPTVETINGVNWSQNLYADGDGYNFGSFTAPIPCNGATIIAVVKPTRNAIANGWDSVVDCFYNNLVLGIANNTGEVIVRRNGTQKNTGAFIEDGQKTVLSLVVQPDGTYAVYSNSMQIASETTASAFTQFAPGTEAFMKNITIGRNWPDGWTTFNGSIGDIFIYKKALDTTKLNSMVASLGTKFGINTATYTITASAGANGTISPVGAATVPAEVNKTYTITPAAGYKISDVLVDGVSKIADVAIVNKVGTYTFTNITANHTIAATFEALPPQIISGKVTNAATGAAIAGAKVYFKSAANAAPSFTAITDSQGMYSQSVAATTWYIAAGAAGYFNTTTDLVVAVDAAPVTDQNIALTVNPNYYAIPSEADLLFAINTDSLPASGNTGPWATYAPAGASFATIGTPTVDLVGTAPVKWEKNVANGMGYYNTWTWTSPVAVNGVSAVAVVKPIRGRNDRGWTPIIDVLFGAFRLGVNNSNGQIILTRSNPSGTQTQVNSTYVIPDGQTTVISTVVKPDGSFEIWANGTSVMTGAALTGGVTSLVNGTRRLVCVGTSQDDTNATFNGGIGDVMMWKIALAAADRTALETTLMSKFHAGAAYTANTITASTNNASGGTITPSGAVSVQYEADKTFTITKNYGFVADVVVDGVSQGDIASYTFNDVVAAHTITVNYSQMPTRIISGTVTAKVGGGATVSVKPTATALPGQSCLTDANGNYSMVVPEGAYYVCASQTGFMISADTVCNATGDQVIDFTLTAGRNVPAMESLLFAADSNGLGAIGTTANWTLLYNTVPVSPAITAATPIATPVATKWRGIKYSYDIFSEGDGFRLNQPVNGVSTVTSPIPATGATVVAVVKPVRNAGANNWQSIVDIFRDNLILGMDKDDGHIFVRRNNVDTRSSVQIPDGQLTILSLVVQPDGQYKVYASAFNGAAGKFDAPTVAINSTATSAFSAFIPGQVANDDYRKYINIGRNNGDGWSTFSGYIGDIFVYKTALTDSDRAVLEADINAKTTNVTTWNITATAGANGSISPAGVFAVGEGDSQTYTITPAFGYNIADVLVDGVSNAAAVTAGSYTFTNVTAAHTISASFAAKPSVAVTGKVTNGTNPIAGAKVYVSNAANASAAPLYIVTTDASGNYSVNLFSGTWYVCASASGYKTSADLTVTVASAPVANPDIVLAASDLNIPQMDQLLMSAVSTDLTANGATTNPWAMIHPKGINLTLQGNPALETVDGVQWEKNTYAGATGYNRGQFTSAIPTTGVTAVAVVRPNGDGTNGGNWTSIIDVMYNRVILGIKGTDGTLVVNRLGVRQDGPKIPNGQKTVLSLVVQPTGEYKVFANGIQVMENTTTADMTQLDPKWNGGGLGFWSYINVGRNNPDGWTTYQGNIGGAFLWKTAISSFERINFEKNLGTKFGITMPTYRTITVNCGAGGTITPAGNQMVIDGSNLSFTITPNLGYKIVDVTVDGVSQGAVGTLDLTAITADHTVAATFAVVPQYTVSGQVTDKKTGAAVAGASVYISKTANAKTAPAYTATTDASGNWSQVVYEGAYFACADATNYYTTADQAVNANGNLTGINFALTSTTRNIPRTDDLLFSVVTDTLPWSGATGPWATYLPAGETLATMGTPTVEVIDGIKWEKNIALTYNPDTWEADGFRYGPNYADPIPVNGATIVVAVKPSRNTTATGWTSIVDVFYDRLTLGIRNTDGSVAVRRNGKMYSTAADVIPDGQKTVLSMVVKPTGEFTVFANGVEIMNETSTSDMTSLVPLGAGAFANAINVGRNQPDGWTTFNGNIGDVFLYKVALEESERAQLEQDISTKFDIHVPVFTTVGGKVTLDDGVTPIAGAKITCIGNVTTETTSDADGNYSVRAEVGSYVSITASLDSYLMVAPIDGQYDFVVGSDPVADKNFQFTPINTITGIVKDINGKPINNAVVQIGGIGGPGALTGPDGKYKVSNVTIGSVELYADALGYADNTQTIDTTPAATGPFNVDITLAAKAETNVIKNGGFEQVTNGVPNDWKLIWLRTATDWAVVYDNPVPGNTDLFSATTDCVTGSYAGKYSTTSTWTFMSQEVRVIPGNTYNFYMKLKGDAGVPNIFPIFAFRNDANEELAGYVSAEDAPYNGWAFAPPANWKSFLNWNTYAAGLAKVPSLRITPPAGATKLTVWIGVTDAPAGKAIYADDVVIDRVGPDTLPTVDVTSVKDLKAQPEGTPVKLVGSVTVTLAPTADGIFYVGDSSRINGLRVVKSGAVLNAGDTVTDLTGTVKKTAAGEVYLELDAVPTGTAGTKIAPLAMNNRAACQDSKTLSNLVKVWGTVTVNGGNFTITDGYSTPITVLTNGATLPEGFDGSTVAITGVVSKDDNGNIVILLGSL